MKIALSLLALDRLLDRDIARIADVARMAEERDLDQLSVAEHTIMSENIDAYPYGKFAFPVDEPWYDPFMLLATVAAATSRIGLGSGAIISPLRPATVLAKEIATLDRLAHGRVTLSLGVGWQKEEYDAAGVPWDGRFGRLMEQIEVCRALWAQAPASFHGRHVSFERLYSLPFPEQGRSLPIWLGVAPTERNIDRMAAFADGWTPVERDPERLAEPIRRIHAALAARGRSAGDFAIRVQVTPPLAGSRLDRDAVLDQAQRARAAGATMLLFTCGLYCRTLRELEVMLDDLAELKARLEDDGRQR